MRQDQATVLVLHWDKTKQLYWSYTETRPSNCKVLQWDKTKQLHWSYTETRPSNYTGPTLEKKRSNKVTLYLMYIWRDDLSSRPFQHEWNIFPWVWLRPVVPWHQLDIRHLQDLIDITSKLWILRKFWIPEMWCEHCFRSCTDSQWSRTRIQTIFNLGVAWRVNNQCSARRQIKASQVFLKFCFTIQIWI